MKQTTLLVLSANKLRFLQKGSFFDFILRHTILGFIWAKIYNEKVEY